MLQKVNLVLIIVVSLLVIAVSIQMWITQRYNTLAISALTAQFADIKAEMQAAKRASATDVDEASSQQSGGSRGLVRLSSPLGLPGVYSLPSAGSLSLTRLLTAARLTNLPADAKIEVHREIHGERAVIMRCHWSDLASGQVSVQLQAEDEVHVELDGSTEGSDVSDDNADGVSEK